MRLGILISGRGSNMVAIREAISQGLIDAEIATVLGNKKDASGLDTARGFGINTIFLDPQKYPNKEAYDQSVVDALRGCGAELLCLAGYMRLVTPVLLRAYPERVINIHPSLLPAFPGLHAQRQAVEHGARVSGCTVHLVDEQVDHGSIILQTAVEVKANDTEETLSARILEQEHKLYPKAVALFAEGRVKIEGGKVIIK